MTLRLMVGRASGAVEPGATSELQVRVANTSQIVLAVQLDVLGIAGWATIEPAELRLFPGDIGDAAVRFTPPRTPAVEAGSHDFAVRARTSDGQSTVQEGQVTVSPFFELSARLRPEVARARGSAKYQLTVVNLGNSRRALTISADEPNDLLRIAIPSQYLIVEPGDSATCAIRAQTLQMLQAGEHVRFKVTASGDGKLPTVVDGGLQVRRSHAAWLLRAAAIVGVLAVGVVMFLALRPDDVTTTAQNKAAATGATVGLPTTTSAVTEPATTATTGGSIEQTAASSQDTSDTTPPTSAGDVTPALEPTTGRGDATVPTPAATTTTTAPPPSTTSTSTTTTTPARTGPGWAVVDATGAVQHAGGATASRTGTGLYTFTFTEPKTACAITASATGTAARTVTVAAATTTSAKVQVRDLLGNAVNTGLSVIRSCGKDVTAFAVVTSTGTPAKSSALAATTSRTKTGTYTVAFNSTAVSASTCTPVVTPGGSTSTIDSPHFAGVSAAVTQSGKTTFTVVLRNPITGFTSDGGFHFTLRCGGILPHGRFVNRVVQNGAVNIASYPPPNSPILFPSPPTTGLTQVRTASGASISSCAAVVSARDDSSFLSLTGGAAAVVNFVKTSIVDIRDVPHADIRTATGAGAVDRNLDIHLSCT